MEVKELTFTDVWVPQIQSWILEEVRLAELTVQTVGVMHTVVTDSTTDIAPGVIHGRVKVTLGGVVMAFTF